MNAFKNKTRTYVNTLIENPIAAVCAMFRGTELDHGGLWSRVARGSLSVHDPTLAAPGTPCPFLMAPTTPGCSIRRAGFTPTAQRFGIPFELVEEPADTLLKDRLLGPAI